ncbi:MAG: HEAT repeat domain-containing protein [Chloroflexi bacterium]|nr:HEAT repeat domain-containing protein [Chloroflexota bacterium]
MSNESSNQKGQEPFLGGLLDHFAPRLGGDKGAQSWVRALKDKDQRLAAIQSLMEMGPEAVPALITALEDRNRFVRESAAHVLGHSRDRRAVLPLCAALADSEAAVRQVAAYALGRLNDVRAVPSLMFALRDIKQPVVDAAAFALSHIEFPADLRAAVESYPEVSR